MKIRQYFAILLGVALLAASCSKDDDNREPDGTITLNMMNEDNGKTELGGSDVYIDNANNFYGPSCLIAQLGARGTLGKSYEPVLGALAEKVAVVPGHTYQLFRARALEEFPSGAVAVSIDADYYNVYVESAITREGETVGATVKYALADVPDHGLPASDEFVGEIDWKNPEIVIQLDTSDIEFEVYDSHDRAELIKDGKKLVIRLIDAEYSYPEYFTVSLRAASSYTWFHVRINYPD